MTTRRLFLKSSGLAMFGIGAAVTGLVLTLEEES